MLSSTPHDQHTDRLSCICGSVFIIIISNLAGLIRSSSPAGLSSVWWCCRGVPLLLDLGWGLALDGGTNTMHHHLGSSTTRLSHLSPARLTFTFRCKQKRCNVNGCYTYLLLLASLTKFEICGCSMRSVIWCVWPSATGKLFRVIKHYYYITFFQQVFLLH